MIPLFFSIRRGRSSRVSKKPLPINRRGPKRGGSVSPRPRSNPMVDALKTDAARKFIKLGVNFARSRMRKRPQMTSQYIPPSIAGGITYSFYRALRRRPPRWLQKEIKAATTQSYNRTASYFITSQSSVDTTKAATGYQVVFEYQTPAYHSFKSIVFNTILNGTAATSIAQTDYNKRVFIQRYFSKDIITNFDYSTVLIDIYVWTPRTRSTKSPLECWETYSKEDGLSTPGTDYDDSSDFGAQTAALRVPYTSPFNCRSLTETYRCVHKKRIELQGGCSHSFTLSVPINQLYTGYSLYTNALGAEFVKNDFLRMYVVNGTPVIIPDTTQPFSSQTITTSKIGVGLVTLLGGSGCVIGTTTKGNILQNNISVVTTAEVVPTDLNKPTD